jgi:ketosteroid isomerase-like protein
VSDDKALESTIHALIRAELAGDVATLERLIAADYHGFDPTGQPQDRETIVGRYRSGAVQLTELTPTDLEFRIVGGIGLVSGRTRIRGRTGAHDFDVNLRFLDVYRREHAGWQLIASTVTPVPVG